VTLLADSKGLKLYRAPVNYVTDYTPVRPIEFHISRVRTDLSDFIDEAFPSVVARLTSRRRGTGVPNPSIGSSSMAMSAITNTWTSRDR